MRKSATEKKVKSVLQNDFERKKFFLASIAGDNACVFCFFHNVMMIMINCETLTCYGIIISTTIKSRIYCMTGYIHSINWKIVQFSLTSIYPSPLSLSFVSDNNESGNNSHCGGKWWVFSPPKVYLFILFNFLPRISFFMKSFNFMHY